MGGGRHLSMDGTSRATGDSHAQICERVGVKSPGRLGGDQRWSSLRRQLLDHPPMALRFCCTRDISSESGFVGLQQYLLLDIPVQTALDSFSA